MFYYPTLCHLKSIIIFFGWQCGQSLGRKTLHEVFHNLGTHSFCVHTLRANDLSQQTVDRPVRTENPVGNTLEHCNGLLLDPWFCPVKLCDAKELVECTSEYKTAQVPQLVRHGILDDAGVRLAECVEYFLVNLGWSHFTKLVSLEPNIGHIHMFAGT